MPIDPEISLDAKAPPPSNPLSIDTIGKFADVQNSLNQARLFQQTFAARQTAGQILASAPDMDTGIAQLQKNPLTSAFAPDIAQTIQGTQNAILSYKSEVASQSQTGLQALFKSLPAVIEDPTQWESAVAANLDTLTPQARAKAAPAFEAIRQGLLNNLPEEPGAARDALNRRMGAFAMAAGVTPDVVYGLTGTVPPQMADVPNPAGGTTKQVVGGFQNSPVMGRTPTAIEEGNLGASVHSSQELTEGANTLLDSLPTRINSLDQMVKAMGQFQTGGGAPARQSIAQLAQGLKNIGLPISQDVVDKIGNGSLSASQFFNTQLKPLLVKQLSSDAHGSGRVMLPEVDAYLHLLDTAKDPKAILGALNQIRLGYQIGYDKSQKWNDWRSAGGDPAQFQQHYAETFDRSKLPEKAGSMNLGPTPDSAVLGAGAPPKRSLDDIMRAARGGRQ